MQQKVVGWDSLSVSSHSGGLTCPTLPDWERISDLGDTDNLIIGHKRSVYIWIYKPKLLGWIGLE